MMYRVTATALNLRTAASTDSARLAVLPKDATVTSVDDAAPTPGWLKLAWNGTTGYSSAQFLEANSGTTQAPATGPVEAAPPVDQRDRDLSKLHPGVRSSVSTVVRILNEEHNLPFRVFEAFRTPERQAYIYSQGRTRPGGIVTRAGAWQSMHQYGLAADLVLFSNGTWSWGGPAGAWQTMHEVALANNLQILDFEAPHVELKGANWHDYLAGRFPAGGDDTWFDAVMGAARRWKANGGSPEGPEPSGDERPPLDEQGGQPNA